MITTKKITALYCRVSTDIQRERESVSTQRKRLKEYCEREGINHIHEFVDDGFSGGDLNRPQMKLLMAELKDGNIGSLIVTSMDRLSRSMTDQESLLEIFESCNVRLVALDQNIDTAKQKDDFYSDINLNTHSFIAQNERTLIRARVKKAMFQRAKDGRWNGGVIPFGYTTFGLEVKKLMNQGMDEDHARVQARKVCPEGKKLYIYETEAKVVRLMFSKFVDSNSLGIVRNFLNNHSMLTRRGECWARSSVGRILKTPVYIGRMWYGKRKTARKGKGLIVMPKESWQITQGLHESIVSADIFEKVQTLLAAKKKNHLRFDTKYLLAGLLKCAKCGCGMQGKSTMKKDGKIHAYYRCYTRDQRGDCDTRPVRKEMVEQKIVDTILALYEGQTLLDMKAALRRHNEHLEKSKGPLQAEIQTLEKRNDQIGKKRVVLYELVEEGTISRSDFKNRLDQITGELVHNQTKLEDLKVQFLEAKGKGVNFERVYQLVSSLPNLWKKANFTQRKSILQRLIKQIRFQDMNTPLQIELNLRVGDFDRTGMHARHTANRPLSHFAYTIQVRLPKPFEQIKPLTFGDRLRYARMKKGLRQSDLAQRIGVTKDCLGRWERSQDKPKKDNLNRLKEILGTS